MTDARGNIWSVSTIKDSPENVRRFVARNLAGGVDHMVIVLDGSDPAVEAALTGHPHVTVVIADDEWWRDARPESLNGRQRINANVIQGVARLLGGVDWIFHIDGDEVLWLDRAELLALPAEVEVVRASPLEAVSRWQAEDAVTTFKRLLTQEELQLLAVLGAVRQPNNASYFHGHVSGKSGMRPAAGRWFGTHSVKEESREKVAAHSGDWVRLLHYDAPSGEEFVRKWSVMLEGGKQANFRNQRGRLAGSMSVLLDGRLSAEEARPYFERVYEATMVDDVDTLAELGMLVEVDPDSWSHAPQELSEPCRRQLHELIAGVRTKRKRPFQTPGQGAAVERILGRVASESTVSAQGSA